MRNRIPDARPAPPPRPIRPRSGRPVGLLGLAGFLILLFILGPVLLNMSVDWQWFGSQGLQSVFGTRVTAGFAVFAVGLVGAGIFLAINWLIARRVAVPRDLYPGQQLQVGLGTLNLAIGAATGLAALILGFIAAGAWSTVLIYFNHTAFGTNDPIFHQDIGFYVFELPFFEFLRGWAIGLVILTALGAGGIYAVRPSLFAAGGRPAIDPRVVAHFTFLAVAFLLLQAIGYWFQQYDLLFSQHDALYGVSYTDQNARLFAFQALLVVTLAIALLLLVNLRVRTLIPLAGAVVVWLVAQFVIGGIYPGLVQSITVKPAEQDKERPYIANNIMAT